MRRPLPLMDSVAAFWGRALSICGFNRVGSWVCLKNGVNTGINRPPVITIIRWYKPFPVMCGCLFVGKRGDSKLGSMENHTLGLKQQIWVRKWEIASDVAMEVQWNIKPTTIGYNWILTSHMIWSCPQICGFHSCHQ